MAAQGVRIGLVGLVEHEWLLTIPTLDERDLIYLDFVEEGQRLARELWEEQVRTCASSLLHLCLLLLHLCFARPACLAARAGGWWAIGRGGRAGGQGRACWAPQCYATGCACYCWQRPVLRCGCPQSLGRAQLPAPSL